MSILEIEAAIEKLPSSEVDQLMDWMEKRYWDTWDEQIESDLASGKLDAILNEVDGEIARGLDRPL